VTTPLTNEPQPGTTPPTTSGVPPTAEPPRAPNGQFVAPVDAAGYRYTAQDGVPPYMVGRTAKEAAFLVDEFRRTEPTPQVQYQQPPQYAPQQPQRPSQDEWSLTPGAAFEKEMAWREQSQFQPAIQQTYHGIAQNARALAEMRHKDVFDKYGPEVDLQLRNVPAQQRTIEAYDMAVNIVRGQHARDISEEVVRERVNAEIAKLRTAGGVIRPDAMTGAPQVPAGPDFFADDVPTEFKEMCRKANVTTNNIDNFLERSGYYGRRADGSFDLNAARKVYLDKVKRGEIVTEAR
jgi:hypothetical protein